MQETPSEVRLIPPEYRHSDAAAAETLTLNGETESEEREPFFSLEYQLRDFLASNISSINLNGNRLRFFVDDRGTDGVEYATTVGLIDILAVDDTGAFYVFELKRANSPDRALGQVARYMGWVKQTIGRGRDVHGVIVAKAINDKLKFARSIVPNVHLFEYQVSFTLNAAHDIPVTGSGFFPIAGMAR